MKTWILIVAASIVFAAPISAQIRLGVGGLIQNTSLIGDAPEDGFYRSQIGFGADLFASFHVARDVAIFIQPMYDQRSTALSYTVPTVEDGKIVDSTVDAATFQTTYISIPIGLRIYNSTHRWFFATGAAYSMLQSADLQRPDTADLSLKESMQSYDVSFFAGAGYVLPLGPVDLSFEARYQLGLVDIVGTTNSPQFVTEPIIRQSGLSLYATLEVPLGSSVSDELDTAGHQHVGPRMGPHLFSLPTNQASPFIRTVTTFSMGGGTSVNLEFPTFVINDSLSVTPSGSLVIMTLTARHEQKVKDWMSFHAYVNTIARIGTNVTSLLAQGVNSILGYGFGFNVRILENDQFAVAGGLDLKQSDITNVNIKRWVTGVLDSNKVTTNNPLVDTKPALRAVGSLRGAWSINPTFGVNLFFEGGYGESSTRERESLVAISTSGSVSIDLNPTTSIPLGIMLGGGYRQSPEVAEGTSESAQYLMLRLGQTSSEHFAFGAQLNWLFTSMDQIDPSLSFMVFALDMKLYY